MNCEHMQALVTNIFQRRWEWQEDRKTDLQQGLYRYNTAFMASLEVKTAFDVAKASVVSKGGVEAQVLWGRVAKYVQWKAEEKRKANGWRLPFGGQHDNEYVLPGMMWAGNYWLFFDNKERLICMVNDIIEELRDLDMEPKPESLWWTSTYKVRKR